MRPGVCHQLPNALSRLTRSTLPGGGINDAFPADGSGRRTCRGTEGPVLGGISLTELRADEVDALAAVYVIAVFSLRLG